MRTTLETVVPEYKQRALAGVKALKKL